MLCCRYMVSVALIGSAAIQGAGDAYAAKSCESLLSMSLVHGTVTGAQIEASGIFIPYRSGEAAASKEEYSGLPSFCRIDAKLNPSADSDIRIEVWLPEKNWNGKIVESGNGGFSPALGYSAMADALKKGFAATSSNAGHEGDSGAFALGHPERIIDFGYRAVHEDAVAAKAIVGAYYGTAVKKAYFEGCSTGGRQAYGEAQRYPADFDGIIAGAPGIDFTYQTGTELALVKKVHDDPASFIPPAKLEMLHRAVIAACDQLDGVNDGVIENPLKCHFDPGTLLCKNGDAADCLTKPQLGLARDIYAGVTDSGGNLIYPGLPPGTEMLWAKKFDRSEPMEYGLDAYRDLVLQDPKWDFLSLKVDRDIPLAAQKAGPVLNNSDPNLKLFFQRGGKLLAYHGWTDANSSLRHLAYYKSVADVMGGEPGISNLYRLFFIPGMEHCGGGDGTTTFDLLTALDNWVGTGKAPDMIPASRVIDGKVDRTRPLCPYPKQAVYKGSGSTDSAENFTCAVR